MDNLYSVSSTIQSQIVKMFKENWISQDDLYKYLLPDKVTPMTRLILDRLSGEVSRLPTLKGVWGPLGYFSFAYQSLFRPCHWCTLWTSWFWQFDMFVVCRERTWHSTTSTLSSSVSSVPRAVTTARTAPPALSPSTWSSGPSCSSSSVSSSGACRWWSSSPTSTATSRLSRLPVRSYWE